MSLKGQRKSACIGLRAGVRCIQADRQQSRRHNLHQHGNSIRFHDDLVICDFIACGNLLAYSSEIAFIQTGANGGAQLSFEGWFLKEKTGL